MQVITYAVPVCIYKIVTIAMIPCRLAAVTDSVPVRIYISAGASLYTYAVILANLV